MLVLTGSTRLEDVGRYPYRPTRIADSIAESGLEDRDITVLTLHRGTTVIPNPRRRTALEPEDRLLCFGKLEEMRSMIPSRRQRGRKVKRLPKDPIHDTPTV